MTRMESAKTALSKVVNGLPEDASLGILLLNGKTARSPLAGSLSSISNLQLWQDKEFSADGGTPLGGALKNAAD